MQNRKRSRNRILSLFALSHDMYYVPHSKERTLRSSQSASVASLDIVVPLERDAFLHSDGLPSPSSRLAVLRFCVGGMASSEFPPTNRAGAVNSDNVWMRRESPNSIRLLWYSKRSKHRHCEGLVLVFVTTQDTTLCRQCHTHNDYICCHDDNSLPMRRILIGSPAFLQSLLRRCRQSIREMPDDSSLNAGRTLDYWREFPKRIGGFCHKMIVY